MSVDPNSVSFEISRGHLGPGQNFPEKKIIDPADHPLCQTLAAWLTRLKLSIMKKCLFSVPFHYEVTKISGKTYMLENAFLFHWSLTGQSGIMKGTLSSVPIC